MILLHRKGALYSYLIVVVSITLSERIGVFTGKIIRTAEGRQLDNLSQKRQFILGKTKFVWERKNL
jgi:hypothetical protein